MRQRDVMLIISKTKIFKDSPISTASSYQYFIDRGTD